ncbi:hypothetical protein LWC35_38705 [Pseudonocardia kujensis]|nr:hypothetical protein [Pseudonocardia kujensis]MCE0768785.1 hypothetical protein [Pseudonocardia kujensis]
MPQYPAPLPQLPQRPVPTRTAPTGHLPAPQQVQQFLNTLDKVFTAL